MDMVKIGCISYIFAFGTAVFVLAKCGAGIHQVLIFMRFPVFEDSLASDSFVIASRKSRFDCLNSLTERGYIP